MQNFAYLCGSNAIDTRCMVLWHFEQRQKREALLA